MTVNSSLADRLELLWRRCDDLYQRSIAVSDVRTAVDALNRLAGIAENLSKVQVHTGFESLTLDQQTDYVMNSKIMVAISDRIIRGLDDAERRATEQRQRESANNFAQPSDEVN